MSAKIRTQAQRAALPARHEPYWHALGLGRALGWRKPATGAASWKARIRTAVGYQQGITPNATYEEVCSGRTGHTEAVMVVFDPKVVTYSDLLKVFWEGHDPTQGMRQGGDVGTQYRSGIYVTSDAQAAAAEASKQAYQVELSKQGYGKITSEIDKAKKRATGEMQKGLERLFRRP